MKDKIYIPKNKIVVTPIDDYYGTNRNNSEFNTNINENQKYDVGIVKAVGDQANSAWVGHIVFHTKGFGETVNMPGIGKFKVVDTELMILVRLDQDINNYKK